MADPLLSPGAYDRIRRSLRDAAEGEGLTLGRYRLVRPIGRGGMGTVFEAMDPELGRRVAIKVLRDAFASPEAVERLRREASIAARLVHPNLVSIHEVGSAPGPGGSPAHYLVMDHIEGRTLAEVLARGEATRAERVAILEVVARAVAFAHAHGVVHRDLKPGNVLVESTGRVLLTDFGLAVAPGDDARLTRTGAILGTPAYMAPEQLGGAADARTDVHALGALLYECLTGLPPYGGATPEEAIARVRSEPPRRPRALDRSIPRELEAVALVALEKEPARRYSTAAEFADELARWLAGEPVRARSPGPLGRLVRRVRRRPWPWLAAACALALVAGAAALVLDSRAALERQRRARAIVEEARPLHAGALTALLAGDETSAARLMERYEARLEAARALDPAQGGGWFERAQYWRLAGDPERAWRHVEEGLAREPTSAFGRIERGMLLAARYAAAVRRNAPSFDPPAAGTRLDPDVESWRDQAERDLEEGTRRAGLELPWVRLARAELASLRGDLDGAETLLADLEYAAAKTLRGRIAEARGDDALARIWYTRAIDTDSDHAEAWQARAALESRRAALAWRAGTRDGLGEAEAARADWLEAARARPADPEARLGLARSEVGRAWMLYHAGLDPAPAVDTALEAAAAVPDRLEARRAAWDASRIAVHHDQRSGASAAASIDRAVGHAERLRGTARDDLALRLDRAHLELQRNEPGRALAAFDEALELDRDSSAAHFGRGLALSSLERWAEAVAALEAAAAGLDDGETYPTREQIEGFLSSARARAREMGDG